MTTFGKADKPKAFHLTKWKRDGDSGVILNIGQYRLAAGIHRDHQWGVRLIRHEVHVTVFLCGFGRRLILSVATNYGMPRAGTNYG